MMDIYGYPSGNILAVIAVPDRRGQEQQVYPILTNNMINVIKYICILCCPSYCVYNGL
jgi:hypothetical protein